MHTCSSTDKDKLGIFFGRRAEVARTNAVQPIQPAMAELIEQRERLAGLDTISDEDRGLILEAAALQVRLWGGQMPSRASVLANSLEGLFAALDGAAPVEPPRYPEYEATLAAGYLLETLSAEPETY